MAFTFLSLYFPVSLLQRFRCSKLEQFNSACDLVMKMLPYYKHPPGIALSTSCLAQVLTNSNRTLWSKAFFSEVSVILHQPSSKKKKKSRDISRNKQPIDLKLLSNFSNIKSCTVQFPPAQDINHLSVQNICQVYGTFPTVTQ